MLKSLTLALASVLCGLSPSLFAANDNGPIGTCPPPPLVKDYVKKTVVKTDKGETVQVEIKARLELKVPPLVRCIHEPTYTVTVDGQTYTIDFGGNKALEKQAKSLAGTEVILSGELEKDIVTVTEMKSA